ncbi:triose-phosphate isomerase [Oecophyllibacter saccharovorans]|uniref:triose-phosphate isomerase n=1 Tax=Oecophyllibacter saccharovorans TaxID=2558360 RepID=UPI00114402EA|nr:triose-phosphate isomerase [Oecophyllibacter saccharovorans]QDH15777.1 triose-phosphate isomerase [Oecophyllibacter saccharovorans]
MSTVSKYVIGNWKMQARYDQGIQLARDIASGLASLPPLPVQTVICPSYTQLHGVHTVLEKDRLTPQQLALGAQDCYPTPSGPFTGDISAQMLADLGVKYVILGHSERRQNHQETDAIVRQKVKAATAAGLVPVVCVGEHLTERNEGRAASVLAQQIEGSLTRDFKGLLAYEPVWAIGSGVMPSRKELVHKIRLIQALLPMHLMADDVDTPILYGGSVTSAQALPILSVPGLGGVLVGSASLQAKSFLEIIKAAATVAEREASGKPLPKRFPPSPAKNSTSAKNKDKAASQPATGKGAPSN